MVLEKPVSGPWDTFIASNYWNVVILSISFGLVFMRMLRLHMYWYKYLHLYKYLHVDDNHDIVLFHHYISFFKVRCLGFAVSDLDFRLGMPTAP